MNMKKASLFIIGFFSLILVQANTMPESYVSIGKLSFNQSQWELTIDYFQHIEGGSAIDSIRLTSLSDTVMLTHLQLDTSSDYGWLVLTKDSIDAPFSINPDGDIVSVAGYSLGNEIMEWYSTSETLRFGAVENPMIRKPGEGECIVGINPAPVKDLMYNRFIICNKIEPDSNGVNCNCKATLKGKIYNLNNEPQSYGSFWLDDWFDPDSLGNYEVQVYNFSHECSSIFYQIKLPDPVLGIYWVQKYFNAEPFSFNVSPDSVINLDIHLTEEVPSGIKGQKTTSLVIFPNPTAGQLTIRGFHNRTLQGVITDVKGAEMARYTLNGNKQEQTITLPENLGPGIYVITLLENKQPVFSQKIMVNRFK